MTVHISFDVAPAAGRPEVLVGHARFVNDGPGAISFLPMQAESPSLALKVEDSEGRPVPLPPPPVPDPSAQRFELASGDSYETTYSGFLPAWTEPGSYRVQVRLVSEPQDRTAISHWVDVVVTSLADDTE